jgi:hypothetical protein
MLRNVQNGRKKTKFVIQAEYRISNIQYRMMKAFCSASVGQVLISLHIPERWHAGALLRNRLLYSNAVALMFNVGPMPLADFTKPTGGVAHEYGVGNLSFAAEARPKCSIPKTCKSTSQLIYHRIALERDQRINLIIGDVAAYERSFRQRGGIVPLNVTEQSQ